MGEGRNLAVAGALAGGVVGYMLVPDVTGAVASLALAGFGLGGIVGTLFVGGWRSPPKAAQETAHSSANQSQTRNLNLSLSLIHHHRPNRSHRLATGNRAGIRSMTERAADWYGTAGTTHVWREAPLQALMATGSEGCSGACAGRAQQVERFLPEPERRILRCALLAPLRRGDLHWADPRTSAHARILSHPTARKRSATQSKGTSGKRYSVVQGYLRGL